jgi:methyl-accepting chemotaxis protein
VSLPDKHGTGKTAVNAENINKDGRMSREKAISDIARRVGDLSVSIGGVWGDIDDTARQVEQQSELLQQIETRAVDMSQRANDVHETAQQAFDQSQIVGTQAEHTLDSLDAMFREVTGLIDVVNAFGGQLAGLQATLKRVSNITREVGTISRQTNLLALNAAIEAARAGRHGAGFMVVAREVKSLSESVGVATEEIGATVNELTSELQALMQKADHALTMADTIRLSTDDIGQEVKAMPTSLRSVSDTQRGIAGMSTQISQMLRDVKQDIGGLSAGLSQSSASLASARDTMLSITDASEALTGMSSRLGVETVDTPFITAIEGLAARISARFAQGVAQQDISLGDLFSEDYQPLPGTDPQQFMTAFVTFTDRVLPELQEPMLALSDQIVFCAAVDRNGFLPTHNRKFSQPQIPGDPVWNMANCRNRRLFNDRVGLAAGRSTRDFLMQAYRRDMGNGQHLLMKDLSAPIFVNGRHWGGVRLAYKV